MKEKLKFVHKKKEKQTENGLTERLSVRLARFILRRQKWIESIFVAGCVFSFIAMLFVNVNYDLTEYLPREAASRIGLDRMEETFGYPGTARVMVKDVSLYEAKQYKDQIEAVDGVDQVLWCDAAVNIYAGEDFISMDDIEDYYKDRCAVMDITFDEGDTAKRTSRAVDEIRNLLGEKGCYTGMAVQNKSLKENIERNAADHAGSGDHDFYDPMYYHGRLVRTVPVFDRYGRCHSFKSGNQYFSRNCILSYQQCGYGAAACNVHGLFHFPVGCI